MQNIMRAMLRPCALLLLPVFALCQHSDTAFDGEKSTDAIASLFATHLTNEQCITLYAYLTKQNSIDMGNSDYNELDSSSSPEFITYKVSRVARLTSPLEKNNNDKTEVCVNELQGWYFTKTGSGTDDIDAQKMKYLTEGLRRINKPDLAHKIEALLNQKHHEKIENALKEIGRHNIQQKTMEMIIPLSDGSGYELLIVVLVLLVLGMVITLIIAKSLISARSESLPFSARSNSVKYSYISSLPPNNKFYSVELNSGA